MNPREEDSVSLPPFGDAEVRSGEGFICVGALSSLSGLWVACVTTDASSVPSCEEQIHQTGLMGLFHAAQGAKLRLAICMLWT